MTIRADRPRIDPSAGQPASRSMAIDIPKLITAYYKGVPDPTLPEQRVAFGTSGHRGTSLRNTFNESHVVAITQAICHYRKQRNIDGPLFLGFDTHAISFPAYVSALEVLAANGVDVMVAANGEYTPTPAISHAILTYNRRHARGLADGIVITPSHNPPEFGGFKYNPPHGGPADAPVTRWIEARANDILSVGVESVKRVPYQRAVRAGTTHQHDYLGAYVGDLESVLDVEAMRSGGVRMCVDPLGGAGVHYWSQIAERYRLDLTVVSETVDPTFLFMTVDWDGRIRMDPSSPFAMRRLLDLKDRFDIAFACDTDHDRHGVVTRHAGLLPPNDYLCVAASYLFSNRPKWGAAAAVGKTIVSSTVIDRLAARINRRLFEVPVGFKWFVDGLLESSLAFAGEESAGATYSRKDGQVWTTDKDGIVAALLAAEMSARMEKDPGELYSELVGELGEAFYDRVEAHATLEQKQQLANLEPQHLNAESVAGDAVRSVLTRAPGNGVRINGVKVVTDHGWFAARPSGTEELYKIYAESFVSARHLRDIVHDAQAIVDGVLSAAEPA